jgi:hypothetical protein
MGSNLDSDHGPCKEALLMKQDRLDRRIDALEARQPRVKSDTQKFLEKLTDDELYQLKTIAEKTETKKS